MRIHKARPDLTSFAKHFSSAAIVLEHILEWASAFELMRALPIIAEYFDYVFRSYFKLYSRTANTDVVNLIEGRDVG